MPWIFPYRGRNVAVSCFMPTGGLELGWANSCLLWQPCQTKTRGRTWKKVKPTILLMKKKTRWGLRLSFLTLRYFMRFFCNCEFTLGLSVDQKWFEKVLEHIPGPWAAQSGIVMRPVGLAGPWLESALSCLLPLHLARWGCSNHSTEVMCLKHLLLTSDKLLSTSNFSVRSRIIMLLCALY